MVGSETILEGLERRHKKREPRFAFLIWLLIGVMGVILGRSFYLQIIEGHKWQLQAEENRVAVELLPAPRGIIYDRHETQLLANVASTDVVLDPLLLPSLEHEAPLFDNLPRFIPISHDELRERVAQVRQNGQVVLLHRALAHDDAIALASELNTLP